MKKYIMLAEVCFDWSYGEYSADYIPDIFLGIDEFETKEDCEKRAKELLEKWCDNINYEKSVGARSCYSEVKVREL